MASKNRFAGCEYKKRKNAMTAIEVKAFIKSKRAVVKLDAINTKPAMNAALEKYFLQACDTRGKQIQDFVQNNLVDA